MNVCAATSRRLKKPTHIFRRLVMSSSTGGSNPIVPPTTIAALYLHWRVCSCELGSLSLRVLKLFLDFGLSNKYKSQSSLQNSHFFSQTTLFTLTRNFFWLTNSKKTALFIWVQKIFMSPSGEKDKKLQYTKLINVFFFSGNIWLTLSKLLLDASIEAHILPSYLHCLILLSRLLLFLPVNFFWKYCWLRTLRIGSTYIGDLLLLHSWGWMSSMRTVCHGFFAK